MLEMSRVRTNLTIWARAKGLLLATACPKKAQTRIILIPDPSLMTVRGLKWF